MPVEVIVTKGNPTVSVIIPSLDDLKKQTFQDREIILVKGISPNGRARNEGVKLARGKYLVMIDDDVQLGHHKVIENLIRPFELNQTLDQRQSKANVNIELRPIGLTGASQLIPPDSSYFQKLAARQLPRVYFSIL